MNPDLFQEDPDRLLSEEEKLKNLSNLPSPVTTTPLTGNEKKPTTVQEDINTLTSTPPADVSGLMSDAQEMRETPEERRARVMSTITARLGQSMAGIAGARGGFDTKAGDATTQGALTSQAEAKKSREEQIADLLAQAKAAKDADATKRQALVENITTKLKGTAEARLGAESDIKNKEREQETAHLDSPIDEITAHQLTAGLKKSGFTTPLDMTKITYRMLDKNPALKSAMGMQQLRPIKSTVYRNGVPTDIMTIPGTGEEIVLGEHAFALQQTTDPYTGEKKGIGQGRVAAPIKGLSGAKEVPADQTTGRTFQQLAPKERAYAEKAQKDYIDDRTKLLDGEQALSNAKNDIQMATHNAAAANSLIMQLNRLAGDKGPIRKDEFAMFAGDPAILNRMERYLLTHVEGQVITDKDKSMLQEILNSYEGTLQKKKANLKALHTNSLQQKVGPVSADILDPSTGSVAQPAQQAPAGQPPALQPGQKLQKKGNMWRIVDAQGNTVSQGGQ